MLQVRPSHTVCIMFCNISTTFRHRQSRHCLQQHTGGAGTGSYTGKTKTESPSLKVIALLQAPLALPQKNCPSSPSKKGLLHGQRTRRTKKLHFPIKKALTLIAALLALLCAFLFLLLHLMEEGGKKSLADNR